MTLSNRQYTPTIGASVKLRLFSDYTETGINVWSWLRVRETNPDETQVEVLNGNQPTGRLEMVKTRSIAPPIGWQSRYTIYCKPDQAETVVNNWFTRGIVVRANHLIGDPSGSAFQPMDNSGQPHWKYTEVTDAIPAEDCAKLFRVVKIERQDVYDVYLVPDPTCDHCKGTGIDSLARVNAYRAERGMSPCDAETVSHLGSRQGWDADTQTFECVCVRGGFKKLGRSKRAKLIKEWAVDGWATEYRNLGEHSYWERTRETVIHEWTD